MATIANIVADFRMNTFTLLLNIDLGAGALYPRWCFVVTRRIQTRRRRLEGASFRRGAQGLETR